MVFFGIMTKCNEINELTVLWGLVERFSCLDFGILIALEYIPGSVTHVCLECLEI